MPKVKQTKTTSRKPDLKKKIQKKPATRVKPISNSEPKSCEVAAKVDLPITVPIVYEDEKYLPKYASADAACLDLVAKIPVKMFGGVPTGKSILLSHRSSARIDTGIKVAIPHGYKLCIAARSSYAEKGLVVTNAPGQIDPDYRGPVEVLVINVGREIVEIKDGERIAQCWLEKVRKIQWRPVKELDATERGEGGFGSTGSGV